MSSALAAFRFPDGEVMYGLYHGTSDIMAPGLIDTRDWPSRRAECFGAWDRVKEGEADAEPVEVYAYYGSGHTWTGRASRSQRVFVGPHDPWEDAPDHETHAEEPDWALS